MSTKKTIKTVGFAIRTQARVAVLLVVAGVGWLNAAAQVTPSSEYEATGVAYDGGTFVWAGTADNDWHNPLNWNLLTVPTDDAAVVIGTSANVLLSDSTAALQSVTMSGGTLTFSNWTTRLTATEIALTGGTVTHAVCDTNAGPSNVSRVYFVCTNLFVASGVTINVTEKGYRGAVNAGLYAQGSGGSRDYAGGSYGGRGGVGALDAYTGPAYGSHLTPDAPGSGGGARAANEQGGHGGGVVHINASGRVVLNGTITADGLARNNNAGGGSGGAIFITCRTFVSTNGTFRAQGGNTGQNVGNNGRGGGGGRIALVYDTAAQAALNATDRPTITVWLGGGSGYQGSRYGMPGTLYLSDAGFFPPTNNVLRGGSLLIDGFDSWAPDSLTIDAGRAIFPPGFTLSVANDVLINGIGGGLETSNAVVTVGGDLNAFALTPSFLYGGEQSTLDVGRDLTVRQGEFHWHGAQTETALLRVGRDCTVTNSGTLHLYAAATNGAVPGYGAHVEINGTLIARTNSWVLPYSHLSNGGSVFIEAHRVALDVGGGIDADAKGFGAGLWMDPPAGTPKWGYGPGGGYDMTGGGYGGLGGAKANGLRTGGLTNGSEQMPTDPGSGGATYGSIAGGRGGGLIWLFVEKTLTLDGEIRARGNTTPAIPYPIDVGGGGSGGGIYLRAKRLQGSGSIRADGGVSNYTRAGGGGGGSGGSGGGGRIALWLQVDDFQGVVSADPGRAYDATRTGTVGTLYRGLIPARGSVILLH